MKKYAFSLLSVFFFLGLSFAGGMLRLPILPSPEHYGDVTMDRVAKEKGVEPVVFSHIIHRAKYTCRVCHYELEFSMKAHDTPVVCDKGKMNGRYCAACHNGKRSFGPVDKDGENCGMCHNRNSSSRWTRYRELKEKLPGSRFGNEIDWSRALDEGLITPEDTIMGSTREMVNIKTLKLRAEMAGISAAVFPHKTHEQWLDCSGCHPELFNIKKKTTKTLRMNNMVNGESCGVCHLMVAFPLDDCRQCHPNMKR